MNDSEKGSNGAAGSRSGNLHSERGVGSGLSRERPVPGRCYRDPGPDLLVFKDSAGVRVNYSYDLRLARARVWSSGSAAAAHPSLKICAVSLTAGALGPSIVSAADYE